MKPPKKTKIGKDPAKESSLDLFDSIKELGTLVNVPNKRKPGKKFIGGYVSDDLKRKFQRVARKETGGDARKMLMTLVIEGLKRRGIDVEDEGK